MIDADTDRGRQPSPKTCSGCAFYARDGKHPLQGVCHFEPPKPFPVQGGAGIMGMRPPVQAGDIACHEFKGA